LLAKN